MKFSLLKRNLGGITQINLAGIRPHHEATIALGDGKDYRDRTRKLTLPLEGRGGLSGRLPRRQSARQRAGVGHAAGDRGAGRRDFRPGPHHGEGPITDKYLPDVHVKVIGSGNEDFVSGQTDLRGVFVADGIQGAATVIAQAGPVALRLLSRQRGRGGPAGGDVAAAFRRARPPGRRTYADAGRRVYADAGRRSAAEQKIDEALDSPAAFDFNEQPLSEVVEYLQGKHDIPIQLDTRSLTDAGVTENTPVTKSVKGVNLRSALRLLLRDLSLTYLIKDDVLMITTPEKADEELITRVYPVIDLVLPLGVTDGVEPDFDSLIDLITSTVRPTSWEEVGGPGSIRPLETKMSIVVSQTQEVHEEINDLLRQLRSVSLDQRTKELMLKTWQARQHDNRGAAGSVGGMGGMGGMGGGMGGGGNASNAPAKRAKAAPGAPKRPTSWKASRRRTADSRASNRRS